VTSFARRQDQKLRAGNEPGDLVRMFALDGLVVFTIDDHRGRDDPGDLFRPVVRLGVPHLADGGEECVVFVRRR